MQVSKGKEGVMPPVNFLRAAHEMGEVTYPTDCAHLFYFLCVQYSRRLPGGLDLRKWLAYNYRGGWVGDKSMDARRWDETRTAGRHIVWSRNVGGDDTFGRQWIDRA
jgi:hypothetical protein